MRLPCSIKCADDYKKHERLLLMLCYEKTTKLNKVALKIYMFASCCLYRKLVETFHVVSECNTAVYFS